MVVSNGNLTFLSWRAGIAAVSPDNFVQILCGPVTCDAGHPAFLGATSCSSNTAKLTGFAAALRWIDSVVHRGEHVRILCVSKHASRVVLGVAHARKNIALASRCNDLFFPVQGQVPRYSSPCLWLCQQHRE